MYVDLVVGPSYRNWEINLFLIPATRALGAGSSHAQHAVSCWES